MRPHPPLPASLRIGGGRRDAPADAVGAGGGGSGAGCCAADRGGLGAGGGLRGAGRDAGRGGAQPLPGAGPGRGRSRARRARRRRRAAPAGGDRSRGGAREAGRGVLRGRWAARPLGWHRGGAGPGPAGRRAGSAGGGAGAVLRLCSGATGAGETSRRSFPMVGRGGSSPPCRSRCFTGGCSRRAEPALLPTPMRMPMTCRTSWSGSASRRWGAWRDSIATRSRTASGGWACARGRWRGARTSRFARGAPVRRWRSSWSCPMLPPALSSSGRWSCWWSACSPIRSGGAGRCGRCASRRGWRPAAAGAASWR